MIEGSDQALVARDEELLGLRVSVHLKERGRSSQPESTDNHLDQGAHEKDIVSSSCYQQSSHGSSWFPGLECLDHSQGFG